jgi:hypothetical protein
MINEGWFRIFTDWLSTGNYIPPAADSSILELNEISSGSCQYMEVSMFDSTFLQRLICKSVWTGSFKQSIMSTMSVFSSISYIFENGKFYCRHARIGHVLERMQECMEYEGYPQHSRDFFNDEIIGCITYEFFKQEKISKLYSTWRSGKDPRKGITKRIYSDFLSFCRTELALTLQFNLIKFLKSNKYGLCNKFNLKNTKKVSSKAVEVLVDQKNINWDNSIGVNKRVHSFSKNDCSPSSQLNEVYSEYEYKSSGLHYIRRVGFTDDCNPLLEEFWCLDIFGPNKLLVPIVCSNFISREGVHRIAQLDSMCRINQSPLFFTGNHQLTAYQFAEWAISFRTVQLEDYLLLGLEDEVAIKLVKLKYGVLGDLMVSYTKKQYNAYNQELLSWLHSSGSARVLPLYSNISNWQRKRYASDINFIRVYYDLTPLLNIDKKVRPTQAVLKAVREFENLNSIKNDPGFIRRECKKMVDYFSEPIIEVNRKDKFQVNYQEASRLAVFQRKPELLHNLVPEVYKGCKEDMIKLKVAKDPYMLLENCLTRPKKFVFNRQNQLSYARALLKNETRAFKEKITTFSDPKVVEEVLKKANSLIEIKNPELGKGEKTEKIFAWKKPKDRVKPKAGEENITSVSNRFSALDSVSIFNDLFSDIVVLDNLKSNYKRMMWNSYHYIKNAEIEESRVGRRGSSRKPRGMKRRKKTTTGLPTQTKEEKQKIASKQLDSKIEVLKEALSHNMPCESNFKGKNISMKKVVHKLNCFFKEVKNVDARDFCKVAKKEEKVEVTIQPEPVEVMLKTEPNTVPVLTLESRLEIEYDYRRMDCYSGDARKEKIYENLVKKAIETDKLKSNPDIPKNEIRLSIVEKAKSRNKTVKPEALEMIVEKIFRQKMNDSVEEINSLKDDYRSEYFDNMKYYECDSD